MIATKQEKIKIPTLEENHYFLFNKEFNPTSTGEAMRFILERNLMKKDMPKFIKMIINSPGGEVASCFALIDVMRGSKIPIYTYGLGEISSCGLFTFIAGQKGKRFITKNTSILSHQFSSGTFGKEHELHASITEFNNVSTRILEHYKLCTGLSEANIKKYLLPAEDVYLTAQEAVKYKLADEIIEFN